jgi:DNA repair exonuclease SbcCD ATPase subunit
MSGAKDELRDARQANLEIKTSLQTLSERLTELNAAIEAGEFMRAGKVCVSAQYEIDAALEYLNAAHDAHQALGRCLRTTIKVAA